MKKLVFLFSILLSFYPVCAQDTTLPQTEAAIDQKIKEEMTDSKIDDPKDKEIFYLQMTRQSEKIGYNLGILRSGYALLGIYYAQNRNKEIVELGNQLKKIILGSNNYSVASNIYRRSALALATLGFFGFRLERFQKSNRLCSEN